MHTHALPLSDIKPGQQRKKPVWLSISALLILVISSVLVIISFLNYSNYRKNFLELNLTRYLVVAKDLRQSIEAGLNIGLPPAANTRLRPAMEDLAKQQAGTQYIAIFDDQGAFILQGAVPDAVRLEWQNKLRVSENYWQTSRSDTLELGMPFHNNFNLKTGAVVIGYARQPIENAMADMRRRLLLDTLQTLLLAAACTMAGVYLLTRKMEQELSAVQDVVDKISTSEQAPQLAANTLDATVQQDLNMFAHLSHRALRNLDAAQQKENKE